MCYCVGESVILLLVLKNVLPVLALENVVLPYSGWRMWYLCKQCAAVFRRCMLRHVYWTHHCFDPIHGHIGAAIQGEIHAGQGVHEIPPPTRRSTKPSFQVLRTQIPRKTFRWAGNPARTFQSVERGSRLVEKKSQAGLLNCWAQCRVVKAVFLVKDSPQSWGWWHAFAGGGSNPTRNQIFWNTSDLTQDLSRLNWSSIHLLKFSAENILMNLFLFVLGRQ